jgi:hypothetical protein
MWVLAIATSLFVAFEAATAKWGVDSRPSGDWRPKDD